MAYWISERKRVVEQAWRNLGFILKYLIMIIRTKFDAGQKVWAVVDSTPRQAVLSSVLVEVDADIRHLRYRLTTANMAPIIKTETEIYLSKPKITKSI